MERQVHALPSLPRARVKGHEGAVEVCAASHAPDHLLQIDDPRSPAQPIESFQGSSRFVERRQRVLRCGFPPQPRRQPPEPRPAPRAAEVPVRLLVEVYQDHHWAPLSSSPSSDKTTNERGAYGHLAARFSLASDRGEVRRPIAARRDHLSNYLARSSMQTMQKPQDRHAKRKL